MTGQPHLEDSVLHNRNTKERGIITLFCVLTRSVLFMGKGCLWISNVCNLVISMSENRI